MYNFGFNIFLSTLLPGLLVSVAVYMLLDNVIPYSEFIIWIDSARNNELLFTILLLLSSSFFGELTGSFTGIFERKVLDPIAAKHLMITSEQYDEEWRLYLRSLDSGGNPYISSNAITFKFELRTFLAFLLLAILFLFLGHYYSAVGFATAATIMFYLAKETHYLLADWRNSEFQEQAIDNLNESVDEEFQE